MTKSTEIDQMLTGLVVNNKRVGLNISDLGAQSDMLVKGSDGYEYEVNFSKDGARIYATDDNPDILHGVWTAPSSDKLDGYTTETGGSYFTNMLKINSFFMCSDADMGDAPAATHNYVELSNSLRKDISLNSVMLMYLEAGSTEWKYIKLKGSIPAHGTYLIRGAQVGYPSNETVNVDSYDIEWYDDGKLISFDSTKGGTFYLCAHNNGTIYSDSTGTAVNDPSKFPNTISPFNSSNTPKGYIDCTGAGSISVYGEGNGLTINSGEKLYKCIFHRKYGEDTCSKTNKAWAKRKTNTFLTYCNMEKYDSDDFPYWDQRLKQRLTPKASYLHKTFIDDKSALRTDQPNCINQTLGMQGSVTEANAKDATRCFTWVSVGYYDEYIEYKLATDSTWTRLYSIDKKDYNKNDGMHYYGDKDIELFIDEYSRMKWVSVGQRLNVTHRVIIKKLGAGTYDYRVGRDGDNNYVSETRQFKVKRVQTTEDSSHESFDFVQTTDQQGYGFSDYGAWKKSAYAIGKKYGSDLNSLGFLINTGDMSQNGNRENEWVDYYNGKCVGGLQDIPEMTVIGNNDLGSDLFCTLNDDASTNTSKINSMTIWCWYTFELDPSNPPIFTFKLNNIAKFEKSKVGNWVKSYSADDKTNTYSITYFVPSLYSFNYGGFHFTALNSEFATNSGVYSLYYNDSTIEQAFKGATYYSMYCWAAKDIADHSSVPEIVYMHEIPFCISPIIGDKNYSAKEREANNKGMSKLNHDFSDYLDYADLSRKINITSDNTTKTLIETNLYNSYNSQAQFMFKGGCCFSELFQNYNVKLCLGGHKHTYSLSRPLLENVQYTLSTGSTTYCLTEALKSTINARTVTPNSPIMKNGDQYGTFTYNNSADAFNFDSVGVDTTNLSLVTYCMCQATGYKLSSNNDIPGQGVNWLQEYFPCTSDGSINSGQTWSMCNVITCSAMDKYIELNSCKVIGVTAEDTTSSPAIFDINKQYNIEPYLSTVAGHLGNGSTGGGCKVTIEC